MTIRIGTAFTAGPVHPPARALASGAARMENN